MVIFPGIPPQCNGAWPDKTFYTYAATVANTGTTVALLNIICGSAAIRLEEMKPVARLAGPLNLVVACITGGWG